MKKLALLTLAGALAAGFTFPGTARAELTPWEYFCLVTSDPGQDLADCLDGVPSKSKSKSGAFVAPGGGKGKTVAPGSAQQIRSGLAPRAQQRR